MAIALFEHNARAYDAVSTMLAERGKACVIHPTGTGKSFIGFKLCADRAEQTMLWLSPSEYIFKTQLENLTATGAEAPENITFLTYAKLMLLDDAELEALKPDCIILDEFHRCGAEQWGGGVRRLLAKYPRAQLLGLSATNIRYLDNQRNMADELFESNVASEMTLGEAIVRGILNAPTYILSVFAYQKGYDRLKSRVRRAKSKAVRDEAGRYLEALRRALENAEGMDAIFDKHMTDRAGKYLVFCANAEHMREMMEHVPEWFANIDAAPHVYSAYSDDPATSKAFADFKADSSGHLKLLFCIDMLNEGIHVEDVSGVILFRPTISPIIYKQQIGRALSASKSKEPVIFDIVNNIENLYSIGTVEQEMQTAVSYLQFIGEGAAVVNERFRIIDEVADARLLFERLNDTLTASWDLMYAYAKAYYEKHGDLEVPRRYKTDDGYSLGSWIFTQRKVYAGEQHGVFGKDRIRKLEAIGMTWGSVYDLSWERYYAALRAYWEQHGNIDMQAQFVTEDGVHIGQFLANLRKARSDGKRCAYLTEQRISTLDELGMVWNKFEAVWEQNYAACARYFAEHGNLDIPSGYAAEDGLRLGSWIRTQRRVRDGRSPGRLTDEQIKRLDAIGMEWTDAYTRRWEYGYEQAKKYKERYGNLNVPATYASEEGFPLGKWLKRHLDGSGKNGKTATLVTPERKEKLDALGMIWKKPDPWEARYELAKDYYKAHGNLRIPAQKKIEGVWLAKWVNEQRQIYIGNRPGKLLTAEQVRRLEAIGMVWGPAWSRRSEAEKRARV